jgi:pyruvyl transferase EpsO
VHHRQSRGLHAGLRATIEAWIPPGSEVALTDVPVNRNAGDLFILAVAARLLDDLGCRVVYRAGVRDYRAATARRHVGRSTILVGLGGGNFGDLYPAYQALRERIVTDFPANRMVVLPQTIHFRDPAAQARATRRLSQHRDLRIAVRDQASLEIARTFASEVALLPDLVHGLGFPPNDRSLLTLRSHESGGRLCLMRRDSERAQPNGSTTPSGCEAHVIDWPDVFPDLYRRLATTALLMAVSPGALGATVHARWAAYAGELLTRAIARLSCARHVSTDRLHAAIVARLAGRPVTLVDNAYGKLAAYYEAWWQDDPAVDLATQAPVKR